METSRLRAENQRGIIWIKKNSHKPIRPEPRATSPPCPLMHASDSSPETAAPPCCGGIEEAIERLLKSGNWAQYTGEETERLADQLATHWQSDHVRLCPSGTAALELALRAARLGPGDEVLLCAYDFPGNLRTVEQIGARPALVDCRAHDWTVDSERLIEAVGPQTRAAIVSHLYGSIAEIDRLKAWADERQILLIEDACQAPGGTLDAMPLGSWGTVGVLSFGGGKPLTSGCGGAFLTNDARLAQRAAGIAERPSNAFPLSQIQAALLNPQLQHLDQRAEHRRTAAGRLIKTVATIQYETAGSSGEPPWPSNQPPDSIRRPDYYKVAWFAPSRPTRDRAVTNAQTAGLPVGVGYRSAGRMSKKRCRIDQPVPHADRAGESTLLLDHRVLYADDAALDRLAETLAECMIKAR